MSKKGFEIVDSRQKSSWARREPAYLVSQLRSGKLFIRQIPGPKNSLGLVLFLFPNSYSIYMHDTPAPEFFARSRRDFSHGCIRLEKPAELAAWVLRDNPGWNLQRIHDAMNGSTTQRSISRTRSRSSWFTSRRLYWKMGWSISLTISMDTTRPWSRLSPRVIRIRSEGLKANHQRRTGPTSTWTKLESR